MILYEMIKALRINGTIEVRDSENCKLFTSPTDSKVIEKYKQCRVLEWFPNNINNEIRFVVLIKDEEEDGG